MIIVDVGTSSAGLLLGYEEEKLVVELLKVSWTGLQVESPLSFNYL